jgi:molybdenum cofactor cytidylyltransferase
VASIAIVPAAGKAERFGGPKLLALIKGEPLLDWTLWSLLDGGVDRVVVVAAPGADFSASRFLKDPRVRLVVNDDPARGMFSSIQAGLAVASGDPILILPADMPFITGSTVRDVGDACRRQQRVVVPVHQDQRGHPIAVPGALRRAILAAPADSTLKVALGASLDLRVELPVGDPGVLRDVDTQADLNAPGHEG